MYFLGQVIFLVDCYTGFGVTDCVVQAIQNICYRLYKQMYDFADFTFFVVRFDCPLYLDLELIFRNTIAQIINPERLVIRLLVDLVIGHLNPL